MNKEQEAERKNQAYDMRLRGKSYRQIAAAMDIGVGTAHRWVQETLDDIVLPNVEAVRKQEIDRLMRYLDALDERIGDSDDRAVGLALKVSERLCKMLGVDAPQQIQVEKTETTQVDLAIQDLLNRQKAQNALRLADAASLRTQSSDSDDPLDSGGNSDRLSEAIEDIIAEN